MTRTTGDHRGGDDQGSALDAFASMALLGEALLRSRDRAEVLTRVRAALARMWPGACFMSAAPPAGAVAAPVQAGGQTIGWLRIAAGANRDGAAEAIAALAAMVSAAIDAIDERNRVSEEARRDALTGLFNRRYLDERLDAELARAVRHRRCLGLIMIDVDDFKAINRDHGHAVGDVVLRRLADTIRTSVRQSDVVCRRGGDEIVVLLPEAGSRATGIRARSLVKTVGGQAFVWDGVTLPSATVSAGAASFPRDALDGVGLFQCADEALRRSKQLGKKRATRSGSWERPPFPGV